MKLDPATATLVGAVATTVIGVLTTFIQRRANRRVNDATARHTQAQAVEVEVRTARELLSEVRTSMVERIAEQKSDFQERMEVQRDRHEGSMKILAERVQHLEEQQRRMLAAMLPHSRWDNETVAKVRESHPHWDDPPPLDYQSR